MPEVFVSSVGEVMCALGHLQTYFRTMREGGADALTTLTDEEMKEKDALVVDKIRTMVDMLDKAVGVQTLQNQLGEKVEDAESGPPAPSDDIAAGMQAKIDALKQSLTDLTQSHAIELKDMQEAMDKESGPLKYGS